MEWKSFFILLVLILNSFCVYENPSAWWNAIAVGVMIEMALNHFLPKKVV